MIQYCDGENFFDDDNLGCSIMETYVDEKVRMSEDYKVERIYSEGIFGIDGKIVRYDDYGVDARKKIFSKEKKLNSSFKGRVFEERAFDKACREHCKATKYVKGEIFPSYKILENLKEFIERGEKVKTFDGKEIFIVLGFVLSNDVEYKKAIDVLNYLISVHEKKLHGYLLNVHYKEPVSYAEHLIIESKIQKRSFVNKENSGR